MTKLTEEAGKRLKAKLYKRRYRKTKEGKAADKKYYDSEKGQVARKEYKDSGKNRIANRKFNRSEKGKAKAHKYAVSEKGKAANRRKQKNQRLNLTDGYIVNRFFEKRVCEVTFKEIEAKRVNIQLFRAIKIMREI